MLVIGAKKALKMRVLDRVPCICYPVQFRKNKSRDVLTLLNSESEINAMTLAYTDQLGFKVQKIDISAQKINGSLLATYGIAIAVFQVLDTFGYSWFF